MTDLAMSPVVDTPEETVAVTTAVTTEAVQTSTLITEHEVLIGSTAALTAPSVRRRGFGTVVRALFTTTEKADRPEKRSTPRRYPKHYEFIETAAMSREMYRL